MPKHQSSRSWPQKNGYAKLLNGCPGLTPNQKLANFILIR